MVISNIWYFLSGLTLLSALMVVLAKNPIHSVLYLVFTFFCISGHYVLLNAQFLMAVNIIVYAGAIMVLFLFVIMMFDLKKNQPESKSSLTKLAGSVEPVLYWFCLSLYCVKITCQHPQTLILNPKREWWKP